ncbi:L-aspartate oxidase [Parendozoicomonas sp. Alg238-R29]|uniref:L-aspartate oxidase n=1 Tax=Parendozoicomonas sp. Alg238-R29 TaxID=2993446 RepID=UPI00248F2DD8|nr:L-aspartate oxidase [Parendozoicomonas sp. Alg238-R29]
MQREFYYDALVIGSGAAGLTLALHLAETARVAVLSKRSLEAGATWKAQGGVAAVLTDNDSVDQHVSDTLTAGAGLCQEPAVRFTTKNGPAAIQWMIDQGVPFTRDSDGENYHLTREGGHSQRRIIHAADTTGQAIGNTLLENAKSHPSIDLIENHLAIDLITTNKLGISGNNRCIGAYALDIDNNSVNMFRAKSVVLATGGASKAYLYTSNEDSASGDGIAMGWRAGCRVANMEFNQFHPTCLYHPDARSFLISEAVRGEGGRLLLPDGSQFMHRFDEHGELAPRDIVARAIDHEMKRLGANCIYLDISHKPAAFIKDHFPGIYNRCKELGIDITQEPIPVVPASHYTCGGLLVNHQGRTDIDGLYAIGETSYTGLHGANRLASNSLLECLVYARSAASHIESQLDTPLLDIQVSAWDASKVTDSDEDVVISHNWDELRRFMWDYVGIVRTTKRLLRAKNRISLLQREINEFYSHHQISSDFIELRNLAQVSELIVESALSRRESRGLHYTRDYPEKLPAVADTILTPPL